MFSFFRQGLRLWALWTLAITAALFLNPVGRFGGVELVACLGPLVLAAEPRLRREVAFGLGLPAITLLALIEPGGDPLIRLVTAWLVFAVGVWSIVRVMDGRRELEAIAGRVAFATESEDSLPRFMTALEREVGRARRHEKAFLVLALGADPRSVQNARPEAGRSGLLTALAERRAHLEMHELVTQELHVYADVARGPQSVLALVPEADPEIGERIVARLRESVRDELGFEVQVGVAAFPGDAISAEDLVLVAERNRKASNLRSIRESVEAMDAPAGGELVGESQG